MHDAERMVQKLADALELVLSSDPDMPTHEDDYEGAERVLEEARQWLASEGL